MSPSSTSARSDAHARRERGPLWRRSLELSPFTPRFPTISASWRDMSCRPSVPRLSRSRYDYVRMDVHSHPPEVTVSGGWRLRALFLCRRGRPWALRSFPMRAAGALPLKRSAAGRRPWTTFVVLCGRSESRAGALRGLGREVPAVGGCSQRADVGCRRACALPGRGPDWACPRCTDARVGATDDRECRWLGRSGRSDARARPGRVG
jgi:hypothetical protein